MSGMQRESVEQLLKDSGRPLQPVEEFANYDRQGKPYQFYKSIRWDRWWDEFTSKLTKKGRLQFKSAWDFCQQKGKDATQRELLWQMIGPQPLADPKKKLKVPWLGDWEKRRSSGFWSFTESGKMESVRRVIKERQELLDASKAMAPHVAQMLERWLRLSEKVDMAFGGEPFLEDLAPHTGLAKKRFRAYLRMHSDVQKQVVEIMRQWLLVHGLNPEQPQHWVAMAALAGGVIGGALGSGNGNASPGLPPGITATDLQLAQMFRTKHELYGLEIPGIEVEKEEVVSK